jgi:hypothetical protein
VKRNQKWSTADDDGKRASGLHSVTIEKSHWEGLWECDAFLGFCGFWGLPAFIAFVQSNAFFSGDFCIAEVVQVLFPLEGKGREERIQKARWEEIRCVYPCCCLHYLGYREASLLRACRMHRQRKLDI